MGIGSGKARVGELTFQIHNRPIHPEWFNILENARFSAPRWVADIRIVEGGHAISWSCGDVRLTEVLIGSDHSLPEQGLLYRSDVRHERTARQRPGLGMDYQTCFSAERLDSQVFANLSEELATLGPQGGLLYRHEPSSRLAPAPLSRITVDPNPNRLLIQCFHTYPDERAIVRTQSLFEYAAAVV